MRRYLLSSHSSLAPPGAGAEIYQFVLHKWPCMDWTGHKSNNTTQLCRQQEELIEILDVRQAANFNAVLFRPEHGEMCSTNLLSDRISILTERWADPGYDPLALCANVISGVWSYWMVAFR